MISQKSVDVRTIFVLNCIEHRTLRVSNGELFLEKDDVASGKAITLTKMPFQKILALFVIGDISVTTPLIDNCRKFNIALVVMKANLRPVFFWYLSSEANYLLRKRQYAFSVDNISIAQLIVKNKIANQIKLLLKTRMLDDLTVQSVLLCKKLQKTLPNVGNYKDVLGIEGSAAKAFFTAYYHKFSWSAREPRKRLDFINATLDIGYTILFNYMETFARMFGFDLYIGVYHRPWYKRKSLVCDLMEPFRCIIDAQVRKSINYGQCKESDFLVVNNEFRLKYEKNKDYHKFFFDALISYKSDFYKFILEYYRCFLNDKPISQYPVFNI